VTLQVQFAPLDSTEAFKNEFLTSETCVRIDITRNPPSPSFTIWMTPGNWFSKLATSRPYCLKQDSQGFQMAPVHYSGVSKPAFTGGQIVASMSVSDSVLYVGGMLVFQDFQGHEL
jgi:hypothetical protein